jgi:SAM-dependent methyltransferase
MCGRGTTLNQALAYGWDAAGVDVDAKDTDAYATFLRTWLKNNRLKHRAETATIRRDGKTLGRRFAASVGTSKETWARGESVAVEVITADTLRAADFFRPGSFDVVVTDAPYGVQHGTRSRGTGTGPRGRDVLDRSPLALLEKAVPVWARLLRRGGAMGISWNVRVAPRAELVRVLADAGLEVLGDDATTPDTWEGFEHRVDQAIVRDLVVARRP